MFILAIPLVSAEDCFSVPVKVNYNQDGIAFYEESGLFSDAKDSTFLIFRNGGDVGLSFMCFQDLKIRDSFNYVYAPKAEDIRKGISQEDSMLLFAYVKKVFNALIDVSEGNHVDYIGAFIKLPREGPEDDGLYKERLKTRMELMGRSREEILALSSDYLTFIGNQAKRIYDSISAIPLVKGIAGNEKINLIITDKSINTGLLIKDARLGEIRTFGFEDPTFTIKTTSLDLYGLANSKSTVKDMIKAVDEERIKIEANGFGSQVKMLFINAMVWVYSTFS